LILATENTEKNISELLSPFLKKVPEERQIITTGFNPVIRKELTKLYLFGKKVP